MKNKLTQERLKKLLDYDPETGVFVWKVSTGNVKIGKSAGRKNKGYIHIKIFRKDYAAHRLAWFCMYGYFPENDIDHIDRNPSNNKINNLRHVSRQCNKRNCGNTKANTSGIKGIGWHKKSQKWRSDITINQKNKSLGCYDNFNEAVCARLAGEQCLNWSGCDSNSPAFQYIKTNINGDIK